MIYETNEYEIIYNECDKEYIEELINYLEKEKNNIFNFFDISKLNKKLIIKLYDTIDKFAEYRHNTLYEWSVGNMDVDDNNYYIHILSYKEFIKRKGHEQNKLDYFYKTIIHEFVHVCHENVEPVRKSLIWVREGIAILLSHQYDDVEKKLYKCSLDDLLLNNNRIAYINYYTLMDYALNTYGKEYIKKLVFNNEFAKEQTEKIYNETVDVYGKPYILNSPDSLNYITDKLDDILPSKIDQYKKIFKLDYLEPVRINYFDNIEGFRNFIYELRGTKDTLPEYATGTYDKGMINGYIEPNIIVNSPKYIKKTYLPAHELFHILYMKYVLKNDISKRIVWYDEGMAQFLSGEYSELLDEEKFKRYIDKVKEETKIVPELNNLKHGKEFRNENYDGYKLSYLAIRYLNEILPEEEFYNLMSDFDKIRMYGNTIIQDMFEFYNNEKVR